MPSDNAKEMKCVVTFLSILSIIVLGSFVIDKDIKDILYLSLIIICLIRYLLICRR